MESRGKTDEQVYAEFEEACRHAELPGSHLGFLLDDSGRPVPMYITTSTRPPAKVRRTDITNEITLGMRKTQVRERLGYPDDYLLVIEAGDDPNDNSKDIISEGWYYGNHILWFDRRHDRLVRIERKQSE